MYRILLGVREISLLKSFYSYITIFIYYYINKKNESFREFCTVDRVSSILKIRQVTIFSDVVKLTNR